MSGVDWFLLVRSNYDYCFPSSVSCQKPFRKLNFLIKKILHTYESNIFHEKLPSINARKVAANPPTVHKKKWSNSSSPRDFTSIITRVFTYICGYNRSAIRGILFERRTTIFQIILYTVVI